jgi:hypothetical protein
MRASHRPSGPRAQTDQGSQWELGRKPDIMEHLRGKKIRRQEKARQHKENSIFSRKSPEKVSLQKER